MADLRRVDPKPLPPPPLTYDLTGLTEDEVEMLATILGRFAAGGLTTPLYRLLCNGKVYRAKYTVKAYDSESLSLQEAPTLSLRLIEDGVHDA